MFPDDLHKPQLRAIQYFYVDGTFEFGFGLLCLTLATFLYLETHLQGWLAVLLDASLILVMIGAGWLVRRLIGWLKENVTYPRTGFVTYPRKQGLKRGIRLTLAMAVGGLVAGGAAVLATRAEGRFAVMPVISGLLLGLVMVILGWRARLPRFYFLAALSAAGGLALGWSGLGDNTAITLYYLAFSLVLFVSGGLTLWTYLRSTASAAGGSE
jgi:hypothetical protein